MSQEQPQLKNGQKIIGSKVIRGRTHLQVLCHCGSTRFSQKFNAFRSSSCGCLTKQIISSYRTVHGHAKHGFETPTWKSWKSMHDRCYLKTHKSYKDYGGRGISVCTRWNDFERFLDDMGERPTGKQLGRINNELGYSPKNCRWETPVENCNNRRSNRKITQDGVTRTVSEWARLIGLHPSTLSKRLEKGWPEAQALMWPYRIRRPTF